LHTIPVKNAHVHAVRLCEQQCFVLRERDEAADKFEEACFGEPDVKCVQNFGILDNHEGVTRKRPLHAWLRIASAASPPRHVALSVAWSSWAPVTWCPGPTRLRDRGGSPFLEHSPHAVLALGNRLGAVHGPLWGHPLQRAERPTPPAVGAAHGQVCAVGRTARHGARRVRRRGYHVAAWWRGSRMNYLSLHVRPLVLALQIREEHDTPITISLIQGGSMIILMFVFFSCLWSCLVHST
jgi:hypothetical protein